MGPRPIALTDVGRALGEGWCVFTRGAVRGECVLTPAGSLGMAGEDYRDFNAAAVFRPEGAGGALRLFAGRLRERGLPGLIVALSTAAAEAAPAAAELELADDGVAPLMCVRAADARHAAHEYAVRRVADQEGVEAAADVLGDAFDIPLDWCRAMLGPAFAHLPGADLFLAGLHGHALAVAGTGRLGATVGLYAVGTRPSHRRRGAASAALSAAIDHHVRAGAHLFCVLSAPSAEPLYADLGFAVVDHPRVWSVEDR